MKKGHVKATYDEAYVKENRTFPVGKTILLGVLLIVQIVMITVAFCFDPKPQDIIREYDVTVVTKADGSLDIQYRFLWEAMDTSEDLTWIEIGMANENFTVYDDSVSDTIRKYSKSSDDEGIYLTLDLDRAYRGGELLEFSFTVNQKKMLCKDDEGYFFEFVPGWFNSTPVDRYDFRWLKDGKIRSAEGAQSKGNDYYQWSGSLECGGYLTMKVRYGQSGFIGCDTVSYREFDDSGAYDALRGDRFGIIMLALLAAALLLLVQIWVVDSVVSYHRGRGFLSGHGYYVHAYGRSNPYYIRARDRYNASHAGSHSGRGGGCACACACACAGGGRAGCSQKDTYSNS